MADSSQQVPQVVVQLSTGTARLGDLIAMDIQIHHPLFLQIDPPHWPKALSTFEVHDSTALPIQADAHEAITHFQALLQNFSTGPQLLPPLELSYHDLMGHTQTLKTSTMTVVIQEVAPGPKDTGDIRGIRGVVGPIAWSPWWWLLAVILLALFGFGLWQTRKRVIEGPPPPPPEPSDLKALRRLQELLATGWIETGKIKEFYSGLSDIVRTYLEEVFKAQALERTTAEIMRQMRKKSDVTNAALSELQTLLDGCDLVKFAKFRPDAEEALRDHASALRFIEATRKRSAP
jgi:hypothetical protein